MRVGEEYWAGEGDEGEMGGASWDAPVREAWGEWESREGEVPPLHGNVGVSVEQSRGGYGGGYDRGFDRYEDVQAPAPAPLSAPLHPQQGYSMDQGYEVMEQGYRGVEQGYTGREGMPTRGESERRNSGAGYEDYEKHGDGEYGMMPPQQPGERMTRKLEQWAMDMGLSVPGPMTHQSQMSVAPSGTRRGGHTKVGYHQRAELRREIKHRNKSGNGDIITWSACG